MFFGIIYHIVGGRNWRLRDGHRFSRQHGLVEDAVAGQQHGVARHQASVRRDDENVAGYQALGRHRFNLTCRAIPHDSGNVGRV